MIHSTAQHRLDLDTFAHRAQPADRAATEAWEAPEVAEDPEGAQASSRLVRQLRQAAGRNELELHFQPEVDFATGEVVDMEALIRWAHPERGMLWPADFLPAAEELGGIDALGRWVMARAAREASGWPPGHRCWINASAHELAELSYPGRVGAVIAGGQLPYGALGIDLPEAALGGLGGRAEALCVSLRAVGASLAVEFTGRGLTLAEVNALGLDVIKMGRPLVRGIDADGGLQRQVAEIVRAAAAAGATVVAVGVESWSEAQTLGELGVLRGHGFLFAPPQRGDRARWMLRKGNAARGSYLTDGRAWLQAGAHAAALHDVLPASQLAPPRREATPLPYASIEVEEGRPVRIAPLRGAGQVHLVSVDDPFGRWTARSRS